MLALPSEISHPNPEDYEFIPVDVLSQTPVGEGYSRARRRSFNAPTGFTCSWILPNDEARLLRDFHRYGLRRGADTCLMPVWVDGFFHAQQTRFVEPPKESYVDVFHKRMSAKLMIVEDLGTSLWIELDVADINTARDVATLASQFRVSRMDIFNRVAPDHGTTNLLRAGIGGTEEALLEDISIATSGHTAINTSHANAGSDFGNLISSSLPRTLNVKWTSTGTTPTVCDVLVVIPYTES